MSAAGSMIYVAMIPVMCSIPWLIWLALQSRSSIKHMEIFNPLPRWEEYDRRRAETEEPTR